VRAAEEAGCTPYAWACVTYGFERVEDLVAAGNAALAASAWRDARQAFESLLARGVSRGLGRAELGHLVAGRHQCLASGARAGVVGDFPRAGGRGGDAQDDHRRIYMTTTTHSANAIQIHKASGGDVSRIASTLARAFFDDPVFRWTFPGRRATQGSASRRLVDLHRGVRAVRRDVSRGGRDRRRALGAARASAGQRRVSTSGWRGPPERTSASSRSPSCSTTVICPGPTTTCSSWAWTPSVRGT
jgi:hypothetical protein